MWFHTASSRFVYPCRRLALYHLKKLTKIIDAENSRHGTARPAMSDLGLGGGGIAMFNGGIDLGKGDGDLG